MRRRALAIAWLVTAVAALAAAETTRTLEVTLAGDAAAPFAVENLAGTMTVVAGDGGTVTAVATVHAGDAALAGAMRFEQVAGENGVPTLRVIYPLDREDVIRYSGGDHGRGGHHGLEWLFGFGWDNTNLTYDGHRVRVSSRAGAPLYADVEVRVPKRALSATFRNRVGALSAEGIAGRILLDTGRGAISVRRATGEVKADTGSGAVTAEDVGGSFTCDTGSGPCEITGFDGRELSCDTGSGPVRIRRAKAELINADTGSGPIRVEQAEATEFRGDTGSGGIDAELGGAALRRVKASTGSGHVRLRLPADAGFDADADQGSGDLRCEFADATAVQSRHKVVGFRRGDGRVRIVIDTGSGDAVILPAR